MKNHFCLLLSAIILCGVANACLKYDDAAIRHDISLIDKRLSTLEETVNNFNENISSVQSLVNSLSGKVFVTSVNETENGYVIYFSDGKLATIKNGADGSTPSIGVRQDVDGEWYWILNGDWLLGGDFNKIRVTGRDAVPPQLKIEGDYWYMSSDGGVSWTNLGKASGRDGDPSFSSVTYDESFVYFTLLDGTQFKVSRGAATVQVLSAIPDFSDGSVAAKAGEFTLRFKVAPRSAAESINALSDDFFTLDAVCTHTKATTGDVLSLPIKSKSLSGDIFSVKVDGSPLSEIFSSVSYGASAALTIDDGYTAVSSGFFPLYDDRGKIGGHAYVDLGLSVLWAACNIGAVNPEDAGGFFAWGETSVKSEYSFDTYLWGNPPVKYMGDGKDVLELVDDAANVCWGGAWRMPTKAEIEELCNVENCSWVWAKQGGVQGYRVISKLGEFAGNSIFLPASGRKWNTTEVSDEGIIGNFWSSSANLGEPNDAYIIYIAQNFPRVTSVFRGSGLSVRPVCAR